MSWPTVRGRRGTLVHVPAWDVTTYTEGIATATSEIVAGCVCAACGSRELELTGTWFSRYLGTNRLRGRLAACVACGHHERVLPSRIHQQLAPN